jgi:WD40 repeat protein
MSGARVGLLLQHVRQLLEGRHEAGPDSQLLERFVRHDDQAAFAALVRRHGPPVLGVCRRVLGHEQDAEDVFQAAFLILARKAGAIRKRASAFTSDGKWVLTGGYEGTVRVWDPRTGELHCKFQNLGGVEAIAYAPATRTLAVCGVGNNIQLFELSLEAPTEKEQERIRALLAKIDDDAYAVREEACKQLLEIGFIAEPELRRAIQESKSAEVRIRARRLRAEMLSQPRASLTGHTEQVEYIAFSPDGKLLASASKDGTARLWKVATRKELWRCAAQERRR